MDELHPCPDSSRRLELGELDGWWRLGPAAGLQRPSPAFASGGEQVEVTPSLQRGPNWAQPGPNLGCRSDAWHRPVEILPPHRHE